MEWYIQFIQNFNQKTNNNIPKISLGIYLINIILIIYTTKKAYLL